MLRVSVLLVLLSLCGSAAACPVPTEDGGRIELDAGALARRHASDAIAGGTLDLARCAAIEGRGFVSASPNFTLHLREIGPGGLELRTRAECDTVLIVGAAGGSWLFDDDGGGGKDAALRLRAASEGRYAVWIGTYDPASCRAELIVGGLS